jgi:hypothetical protein
MLLDFDQHMVVATVTAPVTHLEVACSALEPAGSLVNFAFAVSLTSIFGHQPIDFSQWVVIRAHKMNRSNLNGRLSFFKRIFNVYI